MIPDHGTRDNLATVEGQELQQGVFARREVNDLAASLYHARSRIDFQIKNPDNRVFHLMATADQGPQAREQFSQLKRFHQVIIRPGIEPFDPILQLTPRCQNKDMRADTVFAPLLQQGQPISERNHQIEEDRIVLRGAGFVIRLVGITGHIHGESFLLQPLAHSPLQRLMILDQQDSHQLFST